MAAGNRAHGSRSGQGASRFWWSVNFDLRPSLTSALSRVRLRAQINITTTYLEL
jgi:hypothetical protein